jgi:hypothetical protein
MLLAAIYDLERTLQESVSPILHHVGSRIDLDLSDVLADSWPQGSPRGVVGLPYPSSSNGVGVVTDKGNRFMGYARRGMLKQTG